MSIKNKKRIFKKLKSLSEEIDYKLSDLDIINITNNIMNSVKKDHDKNLEYSSSNEEEGIRAVDDVILNNSWEHYCSSHVWVGQEFIDSQSKKGLIKNYDYYRFNRGFE